MSKFTLTKSSQHGHQIWRRAYLRLKVKSYLASFTYCRARWLCFFYVLPMEGLSSGIFEVLTSLVPRPFLFFMGFTFFVTFTGCSMCEGYSMESIFGWFGPLLDLQIVHFQQKMLLVKYSSQMENKINFRKMLIFWESKARFLLLSLVLLKISKLWLWLWRASI